MTEKQKNCFGNVKPQKDQDAVIFQYIKLQTHIMHMKFKNYLVLLFFKLI